MSLADYAKFVPFKLAHVDFVGSDLPKDIAVAYIQLGPTVTLMIHDQPFVCMGMVKASDHTAEGWMIVNENLRNKYAKTMTRAVKQWIDCTMQSEGLHRLQITIESSKARYVFWSECVGFKVEGKMEKYDDHGNDYYLMARTKWVE